jgi:arylsulfatase A-like enzyme/Tfp pilus assembly protein PilF
MIAGRETAHPRRRAPGTSWVRAIVAASTVSLSAACARPAPQADLRAIPNQNVLLITIDTLRADALGSYGGRAATPALDRLAAEGVRFTFAHAHAVVTLPSHASMLTGEYPFQHGLRDNSGYRLGANARTAATLLKAAGYATGAFVAAFPVHSRFGLGQGFDIYDDQFGETRAPTEFVMPERPAPAVVALARAWIASTRQPPSQAAPASAAKPHSWFAWIHLFDPHAPYVPSYPDEVAKVDAALAPLLDDLRAAAQPTLVIVTADHGEAMGDHGEQTHGLFAYEATLHVPLIVTEIGGGRSTPGSGEVSAVSARHVDLLPTMLEAVGQRVPADLPGRSLLPAAERRESSTPRPSYFEAMSGTLNRGTAPLTGVLVGREKFIDLPLPERYDLAADPAERTNLAGRVPDRDRTLESLLRGFNAAAPGPRLAESAEAMARLRALGYVAGDAAAKATYTEADDPKRVVDLDAAMHRAVEAYAAGDIDEAARTYRGIVERRADFAIAYRHLAFVESRRGNTREAIAVLQRALAAGVTQPTVVAQLADYLAADGRAAQALQLLAPLAADPSAGADVLNTLGIAYATVGRRAEAERAFERVLTINPDSAVPLENLGMLALERGDLTAAEQRFTAAAKSNPRSSRAHSGVGIVALRRGDRDAAIAAWGRAVDLDPMNFDALYNLGTTLAQAGQMDRARPYLERFVRTAPPAYDRDKREIEKRLSGR